MNIKKVNIVLNDELKKIEKYFIEDSLNNYDIHFDNYIKNKLSLHGKYICSDLFKETFLLFSSKKNRSKYNRIVHNSASCLSEFYFKRIITNSDIKNCIIIAGIPGGGKTRLIQSGILNHMVNDNTIIYEGNITTHHIFEKLDLLKQMNIKTTIIVLNPTLELAVNNVIQRCKTNGRGARFEVMAKIHSNIKYSLMQIVNKYKLDYYIINKKSNFDKITLVKNNNFELLNNGSEEKILNELYAIGKQINHKYNGLTGCVEQ